MMPGAANHGDWLFPLDFPAWSIFYEIIANVLFAALVVRSLGKTQILIGIVLLSCCFLLIWLSLDHSLNVGALLGYSALVAVARLMLSFFNGVLVYRLFARLTTALWTPVRSAWVGLLTVALLALLLTNFLHLAQTRVGQFLIIAALYPAILYVGARCRVASSWTLPCALLGELSYPLYLLHAHFMQYLASFTASRYNHHHHAEGLMLSLTIAAAVATSFAASRLYDIPVRSAVLRFINNPNHKHTEARR
jgi:peptidoglycan/LPS O-acetylase OafA/YrhL